MRKTLLRATALAAALVVLPSSAYAVYVSSANGNGNQYRASSSNNGVTTTGNLGSIQGYGVYYEGLVRTSGFGCSNYNAGRYTTNTDSKTYVAKGGTFSAALGTCSMTGVSSRISRAIGGGLPDPSGNWSSSY